jgi:hypothetical protein
MTIRIESPRNGKARYDIIAQGPAGPVRERRNFPAALKSPSARKRWAEAREAHLTRNGPDEDETPAPTLAEFGDRWLREYVRAEGLKPSTVATYERHLKLHLVPVLGHERLTAIGELQIQRVKLKLEKASAKTRHDVLGTLSNILRTAERWDEIVRAPHVELPRIAVPEMGFYDFEEWEALDRWIARRVRWFWPPSCSVVTLVSAGVSSLPSSNRMYGRRAVHVVRNEWEGHVGSPKGGRGRRIPLTDRLGGGPCRRPAPPRRAPALAASGRKVGIQRCRAGWRRPAGARACRRRGTCTACGTRSARTWRCAGALRR